MNKTFSMIVLAVLIAFISHSQPAGSLSGRVLAGKNSGVSAATIQFLNSNQFAITDSAGYFSIKSLAPGKYTIVLSCVGYASQSREIELKENSNSTINVFLLNATLNLDEVIVTAQKKEELLQQIPISITALSARQIKEYRIWRNNELTAIIPNLYSAHSGDDRNVTSIRGITTTSYDPAVATYIDGVNQFGLDTYISNLVDAERIEVLRGPQGTLYGRNAMGGVINIITKQPTNIPTGFAEINIGNYNQQRISAGIRTPVIKNKLYAGIAAVYQTRDGFYQNNFNNTSYDKQYSFTSNYYLKYIAGKKWNIVANVKHHLNRNKGAFPLVFGIQDALADPFKLSQNATAKMIDNTFNGSLSINRVGQSFNFSSQTSFQSNYRYYNAPLDGDFSPIDGITIINDYGKKWNKVNVFTQEFRFSSAPSRVSKRSWTAGMYLFHQRNPAKQTTHFGEDALLVGVPDNNFSVINSNTGKNAGVALYGQITYNITQKLELTGGVRADYENKKYTVRGEYQKLPDPIFETRPDTSAHINYTAVSPRISLSYQLYSTGQAYTSFSRGFRTGGLTQLSTDPTQSPLYSFKPEYSSNWEFGVKNSFWKNAVRFNISFFYTWVTDAQVPTLVLPDAITVTKNAGRLTSKGFETELAVALLPNLQIDFSLGYTNATYTSLKIAQGGSEVNLSGKKQVFTPRYTRMLAAQYTIPIIRKNNLNAVIRGEFAGIGKQYFDLSNTIEQPSYSFINLRMGLTTKKWELFFWSRNAKNKKFVSYAYDFGAVHLGDPLVVGGTLAVRF